MYLDIVCTVALAHSISSSSKLRISNDNDAKKNTHISIRTPSALFAPNNAIDFSGIKYEFTHRIDSGC